MPQYMRFDSLSYAMRACNGHKVDAYTDKEVNALARITEGTIIVKVVGKVVRGPSTKKPKPFEVGKCYGEMRVLAISNDRIFAQNRTADPTNPWAVQYRLDGSSIGIGYGNLVPEYEEVEGQLVIEEVK